MNVVAVVVVVVVCVQGSSAELLPSDVFVFWG